MTETPAHVLRGLSRAELSRRLTTSLSEHGIEQKELAEAVGCAPQRVQKWCDKNSPEVPGVADIQQMPRPVALDLLRWGSDKHDAHVVELPDVEAGAVVCELQRSVRLMTELTDVIREHSLALADGRLTAAEARKLRREIDEAIAELLRLRMVCDRAVTERVIGLPRAVPVASGEK